MDPFLISQDNKHKKLGVALMQLENLTVSRIDKQLLKHRHCGIQKQIKCHIFYAYLMRGEQLYLAKL